jgi:hypothetical protein
MNEKIEKYCPKCGTEQRVFPAKYCFLCGEKLVPYTRKSEPPLEPIITEEATKIILRAIDKMREHDERRMAEYNDKEKRKIFKKERNLYRNIVSTGGLRLIREIEDGDIYISVVKEDQDGINYDRRIAEYLTKNNAAGSLLWGELGDIMSIPCPPDKKERYFMEFRVEDRPYGEDIDDILWEGGKPYAK